MGQRYRVEKAIDQAVGRRVLSTCWLLAGPGSSTFQMLLFAQAWTMSQQALVPACMASAWVLGVVFGMHIRAEARLWGTSLMLSVLLWLRGTRFTSGQIIQAFPAEVAVYLCTLAALALLLGAISTAWLSQPRLWSPATERVTLARALVGTASGLFVVWLLHAWSGLIGLTCLVPLLVFDVRFARRAPEPEEMGVVGAWASRYWRADLRPPRLPTTSLLRYWWWLCLAGCAQESNGYLLLTLLASCAAVIPGGIWGAVPTAFAGAMLEKHELGKLGWLLGGQIVALVIGVRWLRASRAAVGFTAVVGLLIDVYGSFDRALVIVGLSFLLVLALLVPISIVRSLKQPQRLQLTLSPFRGFAALSWQPGECKEKGVET